MNKDKREKVKEVEEICANEFFYYKEIVKKRNEFMLTFKES